MSSTDPDPVQKDYIDKVIRSSIATKEAMLGDDALREDILRSAAEIGVALKRRNKLLLAGNGGSAADAQHIASEFVGQFSTDRPALPAIALTTDTSALTSVANDYGFEQLYSRQIEALGNPGDVFLAISTSGNSANILMALKVARDKGVFTIGLSGKSGGSMSGLCDLCIRVPSAQTPRIQESHILVGHLLCALVERKLYPKVLA